MTSYDLNMDQFESLKMDIAEIQKKNQKRFKGLVYVDLIGFKHRAHFICKEFSLIDGDFEFHAIIKPPFSLDKLSLSDRKNAVFDINHLHGLKYEYGEIHLIELLQQTYNRLIDKLVIVSNNKKVQRLKYIFRNCVEIVCLSIQDIGYDLTLQSEESYRICDYHSTNFGLRCSLTCAIRLQEIVNNNINLRKCSQKNIVDKNE